MEEEIIRKYEKYMMYMGKNNNNMNEKRGKYVFKNRRRVGM